MFTHPDLIKPTVIVANYDGKLLLDGQFLDGNAYSIMGFVSRKLRQAGNSKQVIDGYLQETKQSDYEHLKAVSFNCLDLEYLDKFADDEDEDEDEDE